MIRSATLLSLMLALGLTWAGCVSAEGALEDAVAAEAAGDYPAAFERYYTALRRDSDVGGGARRQLAEVGDRLIAGAFAQMDGAVPTREARLYIDIEGWSSRAAEVGVGLALPDDFNAARDAAFGRALDARLAEAAAAREAGHFSNALDAIRLAGAYRPTASERQRLDDEARQTYTLWAEHDFAAGRFRRAYAHAESALGYLRNGSEAALALASLQSEILDVGSVRVAFFPVQRSGQSRRSPRAGRDDGQRGGPVARRDARRDRWREVDFVYDLDGFLADDYWTRPPLFVQSADPRDVRRLLRRERDTDGLIDRPSLLAGLSRDLDADLGVAFEVVHSSQTEEERSRDTRSASLRDGGTDTYDRVRIRLEQSATVAYVVLRAGNRLEVCDGEVSRQARETVTIHEADDWRRFRLDRDDRRLFTEDHQREQEDELRAELLASLAGAVADRVFSCVSREVP